jgi:hypothetical protein
MFGLAGIHTMLWWPEKSDLGAHPEPITLPKTQSAPATAPKTSIDAIPFADVPSNRP